MKGRGVRVIDENDLQAVSADATVKSRFVIVDAVGVTEAEFNDTQPLERKKGESLKKLLDRAKPEGAALSWVLRPRATRHVRRSRCASRSAHTKTS